jgi:hypothetical protein
VVVFTEEYVALFERKAAGGLHLPQQDEQVFCSTDVT